LTVDVDGVKVPLTTMGVPEPESVIVNVEASNVPAWTVNTEATLKLPPPVAVLLALFTVKLLNAVAVVLPTVCAPAPFIVTVPLLWLKVPPVCVQLPEILKAPEEFGAVRVPLLSATVPAETVPLEPVKVPPDTVKPPPRV